MTATELRPPATAPAQVLDLLDQRPGSTATAQRTGVLWANYRTIGDQLALELTATQVTTHDPVMRFALGAHHLGASATLVLDVDITQEHSTAPFRYTLTCYSRSGRRAERRMSRTLSKAASVLERRQY